MDLPQRLARKGFIVQQFDEYHFRVNGEFDFWYNAKGCSLSWWDRITDRRGRKPIDQMFHFIVRRFSDVSHQEFVKRLMAIGWIEREAEEAWQKRQLQPITS